ncbi:MAG: hypothetical protein D6813_00985 [Calditrichaeota bacterium]|nr:MAG: hypothetical protein D6813_00985 [Calditrichota bacterium]
MPFTEPTTMLTDYLLALLCLFLAGKLWKVGQKQRQQSIILWTVAFVTTAIAAIAGGTTHGFSLQLSSTLENLLWKLTVYSIGFTSFFMFTGTVYASVSGKVQGWLTGLAILILVIYSVWMLTHDDFLYVILDYLPAMFGIIILQSIACKYQKAASAPWIIGAVLVSFVGAGIQQSELNLHKYFNHNDLYHVIQMIAIWLFYRGVLLMRDRE